jgi:tRNA pseudouridine13 synthase
VGVIEPPQPRPRGRIRSRPGDFLVEEVSTFEPSGQGEHLALWVRKEGIDHRSMIRAVASTCGVGPGRVGWAGMKDRDAVTLQWITVQCADLDAITIDSPNIGVLQAARHDRKIKLGQLTGNRFIIRIRGLDPTAAPGIYRALSGLAAAGLPNHFMEQRFGYRGANAAIGACALRGQWSELIDVWLGTAAPPWPETEQERRDLCAARKYREAAERWPASWAPERLTLEHLARGASPQEAIAEVPLPVRRIWTDAAQATIFNDVLDRRLAAGTAATPVEGDITWSHERFFNDVADADATALRCVPTGPLWGRRLRPSTGTVAAEELAALGRSGLDERDFGGTGAPSGGRRPLVIPVVLPHCGAAFDEHGPYVEISFTLPKGGYATAVVDALIDRGGC